MSDDQSLLRNLGQFFGHVVHAIKHDPTAPTTAKAAEPAVEVREVNREVQIARQGEFILRRTTIDEVLLDKQATPAPSEATKHETEPCP